MSKLIWEEHELTGQQVSGDYLVWDNGGKWYLDELKDCREYVTIAPPFDTEKEAKDAAAKL